MKSIPENFVKVDSELLLLDQYSKDHYIYRVTFVSNDFDLRKNKGYLTLFGTHVIKSKVPANTNNAEKIREALEQIALKEASVYKTLTMNAVDYNHKKGKTLFILDVNSQLGISEVL